MKTFISALLFLLLTRSSLSFAQSDSLASLSDKQITLEEAVISANKAEETKKTVAQEVTVLTAEEISASQSQTTADLLSNVGNVFVQKSQAGGGSPVLRGFEANRVLLVIDGVRMNNIIYRGGHLQNIITLDNAILDRVEILYGPSSTVYGSDALGGVVHLYTKKPRFASGDQKQYITGNASSRYGSVNNEFTSHLDFNIGGKKFASLTSFTYSSFGDLMGGRNQNPFYNHAYGERPYYAERIDGKDSLVKNVNRYLQVQSAYTQYDFLQKFSWKPNDYTTHLVNIQYSGSGDVPRYDRLTDPGGTGLKYAQWYYGPQKRMLGAYDLRISKTTFLFDNLRAGVNYQHIEESRHTRRFNKNDLQHRYESVNVFGANIDFQKSITRHIFRFGIDAQYNTLTSTANVEDIVKNTSLALDTRYPDGENMMANAAIYFSHSYRIRDRLLLTDGLRAGFYSLHSTFVDTSFFHFPFNKADQRNAVYSGSLGLIHTPSDDLKFSLLLATGFRVPNIDDLSKVFESAPGKVIVPNVDLKPEKTINWELGVTRIFHNKSSWENSMYYTKFLDAIVTDKFTFNGQDSLLYDGVMSSILANQNKAEAYLYGFSTAYKSQCATHFLLTLSARYTYGRIKTDSSDYPLDHISPFMTRAEIAYAGKGFSASFFINYNGWKRMKDYYLNGEDNEQYATPEGMPAWVTAHFRVSCKVHKFIVVQAGVDNICDTQYRTFSSGINAPGRNVFAALRVHW